MVSSWGKFVNKLLISKNFILNVFGILSVFNLVIKSFVFDMGCLYFPSGANNSTRYLAVSYVAVLRLGMIGLKVSLCTPSPSLSLWPSAVPKDDPSFEDVGIAFYTISHLQHILFSLTLSGLYFQAFLWGHFQKL